MRIAFHHSHAYPGCRATVAGEPKGGLAEAEFSDGPVVRAAVAPWAPGELLVKLDGYRTSRGTAIGARAWILRRVADDAWKVVARQR